MGEKVSTECVNVRALNYTLVDRVPRQLGGQMSRSRGVEEEKDGVLDTLLALENASGELEVFTLMLKSGPV